MMSVKSGSLVLAFFSVATAYGQAASSGRDVIEPQLRRLESAIGRWRTASAIRAQTEWTVRFPMSILKTGAVPSAAKPGSLASGTPPEEFEASASATFIAQGLKYHLSQEYTSDLMRAMSMDVAYDGKHFQLLEKVSSELSYSKAERGDYLGIFLPVVQLQPFQFLSVRQLGRNTLCVSWPDLFNEKLVHERLRNGTVGSFKAGSAERPIVTFSGGKFEGQQFSYRVFVDGPDGQPTQIDYVGSRGNVLFEIRLDYTKANCDVNWSVATKMTTRAFNDDGKPFISTAANTKEIDLAADVAEDAFTIDLLSANTVFDMDAGKALVGDQPVLPTDPHSSKPEPNTPAEKPANDGKATVREP